LFIFLYPFYVGRRIVCPSMIDGNIHNLLFFSESLHCWDRRTRGVGKNSHSLSNL